MAAGTLYSKIDWADRSPPPKMPPTQVTCDITRLTVSPLNPPVSDGDDLADLLVVGAHVLRRGVRDDLRRAHRVPLGQERQDRDLGVRAVRAGGEPDDPALVR